MSRMRESFRRARMTVLTVLFIVAFYGVEGHLFTQVWAQSRQENQRLEEISERMGIPVERLRRQHPSLVETLTGLFRDPERARLAEQQARLEAVLAKHEADLAANPYRGRIEATKSASRGAEVEGLLRDLAALGSLEGARRPELARKAMLRNLLRARDADAFTLAPLPEGLPALAYARQREMQNRLDSLAQGVRGAIGESDPLRGQVSGAAGGPVAGTGAADSATRRISDLASTLNGDIRIRGRGRPGPRFVDRPLPIQRLERLAPVVQASAQTAAPVPVTPARQAATGALTSVTTQSPSGQAGGGRGAAAASASGGGPAQEILDLAASLDNSPARIFAWVHDNVEYDPKWGQVRSPRGTLLERRGTSWDQAALLCELLIAAGVTAVLEWGEIEIPAELLLALTGTVEPADAGGVLATGGVPIVLQQIASQTVTARLDHVWVKAHLDYLPNRGVDPVTGATVPDTWIRMDPSLKRYVYTPGIDVARNVPFGLGTYLESGTPLSPRRSYEEVLWDYIRANNIVCTTLEQLKKQGTIVAEAFPYVPGTLRGKVLQVDGEGAAVPDAFRHRIRLAVTNDVGTELVFWESAFADVWGERVEIAYVGATASDDAVIASFGDIFTTPPYLVDLEPVIKVAGLPMAEGAAIGSARETEVRLTITEASGLVTPVSHEALAGEHHVLALDFGKVPRQVLDEHQTLLAAATAAGDDFEAEAETLFLLGATYLANLGRDLDDLSGWTWQRIVKLGTEGLVSQRGDVTTTIGGAPLSFRKAERDVDFAKMTLGVFAADGEDSFKISSFELMGSQGSYLEGEVFNQVVAEQGIASVSALTRSQREGQTLTLVDSGNVGSVLSQVSLDNDAETAIQFAVSQGKVAWVAESPITVNQWTGTGYVIQDPATGAAGYLISGELAGGSGTGAGQGLGSDPLGSESWLGGSLQKLLAFLDQIFAGGQISRPSTQQGDPTNLATGNFWFTETDVTLQARGAQITWTRTYNSRSDQSGPLGYGWSFTFGELLEPQPDGSILYVEADGTEHLFGTDGAGFTSPPGKHFTLVANPGDFNLRRKNGTVSTFELDGRLRSIVDANGNEVSLQYDVDGQLSSITDPAGRQVLTVTVTDSKITQLADLGGRTVVYSYTGDDLTSVEDSGGELWSYAYDSGHNLISRSDPLANTDSYAYDAMDRCIRHVDALGNEERFAYSSAGESAVVTDKRGFDTYLEFDQVGRATLQVDPLGNASRATWDTDNNPLAVTDPRGATTSRTFDSEGNVLTETDPLNETTTFTYDPVFNRILTTTDPGGHVTTNTYDANGNLVERFEVVDGVPRSETFSYDGFGQLTGQVDANTNPTTFDWHPTKGALSQQTDALGNPTTLVTDDLGRPTTISDSGSNNFILTWDDRDRVLTTEDPFGNTSTSVYDRTGRRTSVTTPRGTITTTYDALGRTIRTTDALGNSEQAEYDPEGNVISRTDARGNRTAFTYDATGRVLSRTDPLGNSTTFEYCAELGAAGPAVGSSVSCAETDALGNTWLRDFDELGRVSNMTDPLGRTTKIFYDERGRLTELRDALDRPTEFEYDELDRLLAVVEVNGARTEYTYDGNGNRVNVLDAEGRNWSRTYDELNRIETESDPLGNTTTFEYDALGNLESTLKADGTLITFDYDVRRLTSINLPGGAQETFGYDALGRRTSMSNGEVSETFTFDDLDRILSRSNLTLGQTITYTYDAAGNLASESGPHGLTQYVFDPNNRLVEQSDPATGSYRYHYDQLGRRIKLEYPNGLETKYVFDAASQLLELLSRDGQGQVVDGYSYVYDEVGNRTRMSLLHEPVVHDYQYDTVKRLTRWDRGVDRFEAYSYDDVGNRLTLTDELGTVTYSYDLAHRLSQADRTFTAGGIATTSYSWATTGNLLSATSATETVAYQWDALDRLTGITDGAGARSYGYDPQGIRVRATENGQTRRFQHSFEDVVGVYDLSGTKLSSFTHGPETDEPLAQDSTSDGLAYLHRDALGSVTALSAATGQLVGTRSYSAFGGREAALGTPTPYDFAGRERDGSELLYMRARYYDPSQARFISADPFPGLDEVPASLHDFVYVENNPVNRVDPFGLTSLVEVIKEFTKLVVGGVLLGLTFLAIVVDKLQLDLGLFEAVALVAGWVGLIVTVSWAIDGLIPMEEAILAFALFVLAVVTAGLSGVIAWILSLAGMVILLRGLVKSNADFGSAFDKARAFLQEKYHGAKRRLLEDT